MSYMGEGVYAVRSDDGSVAAIDASGGIIYRTYGYVGGFDTITHGVAWHGTMDNGIIFFSKVGGYITKLTNAENPTILTDDIALVTIGGKRQYVRLHDKKTLYSPERSYDLGYCKITTTSVSYTHLDVYKRQVIHLCMPEDVQGHHAAGKLPGHQGV